MNFNPGEPNNSGGVENAVALSYRNGASHGRWNDETTAPDVSGTRHSLDQGAICHNTGASQVALPGCRGCGVSCASTDCLRNAQGEWAGQCNYDQALRSTHFPAQRSHPFSTCSGYFRAFPDLIFTRNTYLR